MKRTKLLLLIGLASFAAFGQQTYTFKVLANKGTNQVKSGDSWQPLKTGTSLKENDELMIGENAYLGLVHVSGKPVELKKSGPYKVSELAASMKGGTSVLNKYTDFILSSNAEGKKNKLSATGAVHRATETSAIKVMLPESQHTGVYNAMAVINWDGSKITGPYVITIRNIFEDDLAKIETAETSFSMDLTDPKFAKENAYLVEIASKADPKQKSKQHYIKKLSPAEQEKIKNSLSTIMTEVEEPTAMNKLTLAGFYEQNNLFIDAIAAYEECIKLEPDVPFFKEEYDNFLLRHGLKAQ